MTVIVEDTSTHYRLRLAPWQLKLLQDELRDTRKRKAQSKLGVTSEPRCIITTTLPSGRKRVYHLFDRMVLMDVGARKVWPFYFGLQLSEWLREAQPRPSRVVPFNPAVP